MSTHRRTWQRAESRAAALFGARRAVLSGSSGRADLTRSDSTHPTLHIESKLRRTHAARTLHDEVKAAARSEGKVPVLCLADKGRPGFLVCVHSDDLPALVAELAPAAGPIPADVGAPPDWPPRVGRSADLADLAPPEAEGDGQ